MTVMPLMDHDDAAVARMRTPAAVPSAIPMMVVVVSITDADGKVLGLRGSGRSDSGPDENGGSDEQTLHANPPVVRCVPNANAPSRVPENLRTRVRRLRAGATPACAWPLEPLFPPGYSLLPRLDR